MLDHVYFASWLIFFLWCDYSRKTYSPFVKNKWWIHRQCWIDSLRGRLSYLSSALNSNIPKPKLNILCLRWPVPPAEGLSSPVSSLAQQTVYISHSIWSSPLAFVEFPVYCVHARTLSRLENGVRRLWSHFVVQRVGPLRSQFSVPGAPKVTTLPKKVLRI